MKGVLASNDCSGETRWVTHQMAVVYVIFALSIATLPGNGAGAVIGIAKAETDSRSQTR